MQGAWKVGLLVVVFGVLLVAGFQFLGKSVFAQPTDEYYAELESVEGISEGTKVLMAGVPIGTVRRVELTDDVRAKLVLAIDRGVRIPEGSRAAIPTALIGFGDGTLLVLPPARLSGRHVSPGSTLAGSKLSLLEGMFPELGESVSALNETLKATQDLIADRELRDRLTSLLSTTEETVAQFGRLATNIQGVVVTNQASIKSAMGDLAAAMESVRQTAELAANLAGDERWQQSAGEILDSLSRTATKAEELLTSVNEFVNDPELRNPLTASIKNVETITESGTRVATNAEEISKNGIAITKNVEELTLKANALADQASDVLEKIKGFFDRVPGSSSFQGVETSMSLHRDNFLDRFRTDFEAEVPISGGRVHLGIFDAFEANRLNVQFGKDLGSNVRLRYGVYASKPGAGVDFTVAPRLRIQGDLYDLNNPMLDLRTRIDFGNGLLGWVGMNSVFDRNAFTVGLGIRR